MSRRLERVRELVKQEVAKRIIEVLPENLGVVTLQDAEVSEDIKNAEIYVSCLNRESEKEVLRILSDHAKEFQHELGKTLEMRYTPRLEFKIDHGLDKINRIEEILKDIKQ